MSRRCFILMFGTLLFVGCGRQAVSEEPQVSPRGASAGQVNRVPAEESRSRTGTSAPAAKKDPPLDNVMRPSDRIYSGGEPRGDEAFDALAKMGVTTVVSVDGARPNVELARKHGLRYVHIPIGYRSVSPEAGAALTRLVRELDGPFYMHCHHGKHRGPAAAAVACMASDAMGSKEALAFLEAAGTSKEYAGLWRDVANYQPPAAGEKLPELVEVAQVDSLPTAMAAIDRAFDRLELCRDADGSVPPKHPDIVPAREALLVKEGFREAGRMLSEGGDLRLRQWLADAEKLTEALGTALEFGESQAASNRFRSLEKSCQRCHEAYRN